MAVISTATNTLPGRSWVPFGIIFSLLLLLHAHLQNYSFTVSNIELGTTLKMPKPVFDDREEKKLLKSIEGNSTESP